MECKMITISQKPKQGSNVQLKFVNKLYKNKKTMKLKTNKRKKINQCLKTAGTPTFKGRQIVGERKN